MAGGVLVRDFGIRGVHLAYELLEPYDLLVLIDTVHRDGPPGTVYQLEPDPAEAAGTRVDLLDAHELAPEAVLGLVGRLGGRLARVVVVGCEPQSLAHGMGLSDPVAAAVGPAAAAVSALVDAALAGHALSGGGIRDGPSLAGW